MFDHQLLTITEVAVMLRYSASTVYKLVKENKLAHAKRGKLILIPRTAVFAYINEMTSTSMIEN